MNIKEAYEKATEKAKGLEISGCVETTESYIFSTKAKGAENNAPGMIMIEVQKESGKTSYYDNSPDFTKKDPYENIKKLIDGNERALPT